MKAAHTAAAVVVSVAVLMLQGWIDAGQNDLQAQADNAAAAPADVRAQVRTEQIAEARP